MKPELKIPYAKHCETGLLVKAENASLKSQYRCLECERKLLIREGEKRRRHFSHPPTSHAGCSGESLIHKAAKELLKEQVTQELNESGKIYFSQKCVGIEKMGCPKKQRIQRSREIKKWTEVLVEVTHGDFRLDVAIVYGLRPVYGFEVFHKHKVPETKADQLDIKWMELKAEDILNFQPRTPFGYETTEELCLDCENLKRSLTARAPEDARRDEKSKAYNSKIHQCSQVWTTIINQARNLSHRSALKAKCMSSSSGGGR